MTYNIQHVQRANTLTKKWQSILICTCKRDTTQSKVVTTIINDKIEHHNLKKATLDDQMR